MTYNKDERPAQSENEQQSQLKNGIPEAAELLQSLRNSPIMDEMFFLNTSNLCQAIMTIVDTIGELVDDVNVSVENKREVRTQDLTWTKERIWHVRSIAEIIDNRVNHEDFEKMIGAVKEFCKSPT